MLAAAKQTAADRRYHAIRRRAVEAGTWGKYSGPSRQEIDARAANVPNPDAWILGDSDGAGFEPAAEEAPAEPGLDLAAVAERVKTASTKDLFWRVQDAQDAPEFLALYRAELDRRIETKQGASGTLYRRRDCPGGIWRCSLGDAVHARPLATSDAMAAK